MGNNKNSYILGHILRALYHVAGRRTTQSFAAKVIGSIVKTLTQKYPFLKYITINDKGILIEDEVIAISPDINTISEQEIGKAIEAIVRIVYMDIIGKAGLFFISEIKRRAGDDLISNLKDYGVDLASLQIEQHYLYRSRERKKQKVGKGIRKPYGDVSLLGYTWKNVSSWKYDPSKKVCILYNKEGEILDNLHLENIIENYVKNLSESPDEVPEEIEKQINLDNKEMELLKMLHSRDLDAESAISLLHVTKNEFESMVKKLLECELLQYSSFNVIELTEIGISYISDKDSTVFSKKQ